MVIWTGLSFFWFSLWPLFDISMKALHIKQYESYYYIQYDIKSQHQLFSTTSTKEIAMTVTKSHNILQRSRLLLLDKNVFRRVCKYNLSWTFWKMKVIVQYKWSLSIKRSHKDCVRLEGANIRSRWNNK